MSDNDRKWWESHDNLCLTADWMAENGYSAKDLAYFIEKPYKFEECYEKAYAEYTLEMAEQSAEARAYDAEPAMVGTTEEF